MCATAFALLWPHAKNAGAVLTAQDDPARLSDLQLNSILRNDPGLVARNVEAALAAQDPGLANSFAEVAAARGISVPGDLSQRVAEAVGEENSTEHMAKGFLAGLVTGNADDGASLSGTVAGDLCVFGDVRDIMREGKHLAMGEDTDRLVLGLAAAGLAVTAATFVSIGGATPVRAGLTLVKDARKVGRLGEGLTRWAGRSASEMVDVPKLQNAVATGSLARPGQTAGAIKAAIRAEKAGGFVRLAKDVGASARRRGHGARSTRCGSPKGQRISRAPHGLPKPKAARPVPSSEILGRGALLLTAGAFNFALWIFGAVFALFGFLS